MEMTKPLVNSLAMDTPATEPSTMLGGTVLAMAAPVASRAIISRGLCPRRFISVQTGAMDHVSRRLVVANPPAALSTQLQ
jgi:hypothetical protein